MSKSTLINFILASQSEHGAFPSTVHLPHQKVTDYNVFVNCLVLDFLFEYQEISKVRISCQKAIQFILSAESKAKKGQFRFYPINQHPTWMNETLKADIDDTALCNRILYKYGIRSLNKITEITNSINDSFSLKKKPAGETWFKAGVYPTWLDRSLLNNPIDLVANLNMAHLIHLSASNNSLYMPILKMADEALLQFMKGESIINISPYYPQTNELVHALQRCKNAGISECSILLDQYKAGLIVNNKIDMETAICCSYGNSVQWSSEILYLIRNHKD